MKEKPRIAVVAGNLMKPRQLNIFEKLLNEFEVSAFAIDNPALLKAYASSMTLNVFENLKDMPGFMRNLEEHILDYDLIVAYETSALASFQALRIAKKWGKPCVIIANEFHPYFYVNYPNIRAIQVDIFENANIFFATSALSESMLRMEGIPATKIKLLKASVDMQKFSRNETLRTKFRNFIKLQPHEILIVFKDTLEPDAKPMEVLNAFRLLLTTHPKLAAKARLLFVGDGSLAKDLKYRCIDLKIANLVSFLHQDTAPFLVDLYNATDIFLEPRKGNQSFHEDFPMDVLEAMACGAVPVVSQGTVAGEYVGDVGLKITDETFQSMSTALSTLCSENFSLSNESARVLAYAKQNFDPSATKNVLGMQLQDVLAAAKQEGTVKVDIQCELSALTQMLATNRKDEALVRVESLLLQAQQPNKVRSELMRYKGDILYQMNRFEEGMEAYSEAISHDDTNYHAYRGLGFIAFKGHSHEESITFFKKALSKKSDDYSSLFGVGLVHRRLGLNEEAIFWFEKCMHQRRDDSKVMTAMIQACLECVSTEQSRLTLERLIEADQDKENAALILTLGQVLLKEGKIEEGNAMIQKALVLQDKNQKLVMAS